MDSTAATTPEEHSDQKTSPKDMIKYIHQLGMRAGIAIKPKTEVDVLYDILDSSNKDEVPDVSTPATVSLVNADVGRRWPS